MKICKECKKIVENESNFCPNCGYNEFEYYYPPNENNFGVNFKNASTTCCTGENNYHKESSDIINLRKKGNKKKKLIKIYIPIILLIAVIIISFSIEQLWLLIFCIPCAFIALVGCGQSLNTCPNCQTWNSMKENKRTVTGRKNTTVTETRTAKTYDFKNGSRTGNAVQKTQYKVDVPAQIVYYDVELKCSHCGHTTNKKTSKTYK